MAARKKNIVAIDLSAIPKEVRDAVGTELASSLVKNLRLAQRPVVFGRLYDGLYGIVLPTTVILGELAKLLKPYRK